MDETNEHVDNVCAFVAPAEVVLAWTEDPEDPQYPLSLKLFSIWNLRPSKRQEDRRA